MSYYLNEAEKNDLSIRSWWNVIGEIHCTWIGDMARQLNKI